MAIDLGNWVKHFIDMSDTTLTDIVTDSQIINPQPGVSVGATPNSINFYALNSQQGGSSTFAYAPNNGNDFVMMCACRTITGEMSLYWGQSNQDSHYRLQGYTAAQGLNGETPEYTNLLSRRIGVDYIYALVKRSDYIEHYVYDDILAQYVFAGRAKANTVTPSDSFQCGHTINGNGADDYYGICVVHFPDGAPVREEILQAMQYHLTSWKTANKEIYPNWVVENYTMASKRFTEAAKAPSLIGDEYLGVTSDLSVENDGSDLQDRHVTPSQIATYASSRFDGTIPIEGTSIAFPHIGQRDNTASTIVFSANIMVMIPFIRGNDEWNTVGQIGFEFGKIGNTGTSATGWAAAIYDASNSDITKVVEAAVTPIAFDQDGTFNMTINPAGTFRLPAKCYLGFTIGVNATNTGVDFALETAAYSKLLGYPNIYNVLGDVLTIAPPAYVLGVTHGILPATVPKDDLKLDLGGNSYLDGIWCETTGASKT